MIDKTTLLATPTNAEGWRSRLEEPVALGCSFWCLNPSSRDEESNQKPTKTQTYWRALCPSSRSCGGPGCPCYGPGGRPAVAPCRAVPRKTGWGLQPFRRSSERRRHWLHRIPCYRKLKHNEKRVHVFMKHIENQSNQLPLSIPSVDCPISSILPNQAKTLSYLSTSCVFFY